MIRFACPSCRSEFSTPDRAVGKKATCPRCRQRFQILPSVHTHALGQAEPIVCVQTPPRRSGCLVPVAILVGILVVAGAFGGGIWLATGKSFLNSPKAPEVAHNPVIPDEPGHLPPANGLNRHPWWRKKMTSQEIDSVTTAVARLQDDYDRHQGSILVVDSAGNILYVPLDGSPEADSTFGFLGGAEDNVCIIFVPGKRSVSKRLSRAEAGQLLMEMLNAAHASETQYKRTGKGNAFFDQLKQLKAPNIPPLDP